VGGEWQQAMIPQVCRVERFARMDERGARLDRNRLGRT